MNFDGTRFRNRDTSGLEAEIELLAQRVIGAAIEVHKALGPGLTEKVYREALSYELELQQIPHVCEYAVEVFYKGKSVGKGFVDLFVDGKLVVELKAVDTLHGKHTAQTVSYLQVLNLKLGLLINFNVVILKDGLKRVIKS